MNGDSALIQAQSDMIAALVSDYNNLDKKTDELKKELEVARKRKMEDTQIMEDLKISNKKLLIQLKEASARRGVVFIEEEEPCKVVKVKPWQISCDVKPGSGRAPIASASLTATTTSTTSALTTSLIASVTAERSVQEKSKALVKAAREGKLSEVHRLLNQGALVAFATCDYKITALHYAAMYNRVEILGMLISAGAPINARDTEGETPLHWAAKGTSRDVISALIEAGAEVNARCNNYSTPLHAAAGYGRLQSMIVLLSAGAEINAVNIEGHSSLHLAAIYDREHCVQFLLNRGADASLRDKAGYTAKEMANPSTIQALFY